jgi:NAD(P)H-dependent flavin oxidoreductase YrpB (nitropropane dioxygenase family)
MSELLNTRITTLLGCQYPIIQTAMGWVADPKLVAATCNAGGFGFLAGATIPPEEMERDILRVKELTSKNFGVNFHMYQPNANEIIGFCIKHGVKAVSYSRSPGKEMIKRLKDNGIVCMPTIGLPKHAIKAVELGADAVVVQGGEGGGHTGKVPTTLLLPQVVDAVGSKVPVLGAGGFKDGRGLVAAMAFGADGIAMGTRFLLTKDSPVPEATKKRYIDCKDPGNIIVSTAMDGLPQRMIMNEWLADMENASNLRKLVIALRNGLKFRQHTDASIFHLLRSALAMTRDDGLTLAQAVMAANAPMVIMKAMVEGKPAEGVLPSGQVAGVIDSLPGCDQLIQSIVREAEERLNALCSKR